MGRFESMQRPHRKQVKHFDGGREARSLTFSCYHRQPYFSKDRTCQWMIDAIELGRSKHAVHLWAYVIMPDHVHLLIWPSSTEFKMHRYLSTVKQSVSKKARLFLMREQPDYLRKIGNEFHFWQDGPGYDRNIDSYSYVWNDIDYIHENPLRRKLCTSIDAWRWSSAANHLGLRSGPLRIDFESLPEDPRER